MSAPQPRRWPGRVAALAPVLLLVAAGVAAVWGFLAVRATFEQASLAQQIYSTMAMFSGGYLALAEGSAYDPAVPEAIARPSVLAFAVTIAAAGTIVITLSTKARNVIRALSVRPALIVIGSGATATAIVESCLDRRVRALLITERRDSQAARACLHVIPTVTIGSLAESGTYGVSQRVLARAANVVIATDSDSTNLELRQRIMRAPRQPGRRSVIAVVNDAELVEAMRPNKIRDLGEEEVTCPAENIAEHVCLLIDAAATGNAAIAGAKQTSDPHAPPATPHQLVERVVVDIVDATSDSDIGDSVYRWVLRQSWGRKYLCGDQIVGTDLYNPIVPIVVNEKPESSDLLVRIYCGNDGSSVVRRLLRDQADADVQTAALTIVVADKQLATTATETFDGTVVRSGWRWLSTGAKLDGGRGTRGTILVVDPNRVGLDANLVIDDVRLQWARVFDQTYRFMFAGDYAIGGWLPGAPLGSGTAAAERAAVQAIPDAERTDDVVRVAIRRAQKAISDRHSSEAAVRNMIRFLQSSGWKLVRHEGTSAPPRPDFDEALVVNIAEREHEDWRRREWSDTSPGSGLRLPRNTVHRCAEYSTNKLGGYSWDALCKQAQSSDASTAAEFTKTVNYNKRIVTETYPAIAARFGYRIVRVPEIESS